MGLTKKLGASQVANGKEPACQCRRQGFDPWVRKIPWRRPWQPFSILAWRIPWTEEPGGLWSITLQRVRHDWSDLASMEKRSFESFYKMCRKSPMNLLAIPVHVQASVLDTLHRLSKLIVAASIQFNSMKLFEYLVGLLNKVSKCIHWPTLIFVISFIFNSIVLSMLCLTLC